MRLFSLALLLGTASAHVGMTLISYDEWYGRRQADELCYWTLHNWMNICLPFACCRGQIERHYSEGFPAVDEEIAVIKGKWAPLWHFNTDFGKCWIGAKRFCCTPIPLLHVIKGMTSVIKVHYKILGEVNGTAKTAPAQLPLWARQHNMRVAGEEFPAPLEDSHDNGVVH